MTTGEATAPKLYNDIPAELQPFYDHILCEASMRRLDHKYYVMTVTLKNCLRDNPQTFDDVARILTVLEQTVFSASLASILAILGTDRSNE